MSSAAGAESGLVLRSLLVAAAALAALVVLGGSVGLAGLRDLPARAADAVLGEQGRDQGAAQISGSEFVGVRDGATPKQVRAQLGEPEARAADTVEGLEIECWLYGVSRATGAFQLCFVDGRLRARARYG